jgi:hypothetical protein
MDSHNANVETFRANWIFILLLVLSGAVMLATAFGSFVFTCTIALPPHAYDLTRGVRLWLGSLAGGFLAIFPCGGSTFTD